MISPGPTEPRRRPATELPTAYDSAASEADLAFRKLGQMIMAGMDTADALLHMMPRERFVMREDARARVEARARGLAPRPATPPERTDRREFSDGFSQ